MRKFSLYKKRYCQVGPCQRMATFSFLEKQCPYFLIRELSAVATEQNITNAIRELLSDEKKTLKPYQAGNIERGR